MTPPTPDTVETIIVVDDEVLVRTAIAEYLRSCGYRVLEVAHSEDAQALLGDDCHVDIVLSAVSMREGIDGFALQRWIRENRPEIRVILAGTLARATSAAAELCDSGPMLARPYDPQIVLDRIKRTLAARPSSAEDE